MTDDATYRKGYRQGVLDATVPISDEKYAGYHFCGTPVESVFNGFLRDRRQNLMSRKVTKWVNVGRPEPSVSDPASIRYGYGTLYDDKSTAEANIWSMGGYIGTFPIEIEEPI